MVVLYTVTDRIIIWCFRIIRFLGPVAYGAHVFQDSYECDPVHLWMTVSYCIVSSLDSPSRFPFTTVVSNLKIPVRKLARKRLGQVWTSYVSGWCWINNLPIAAFLVLGLQVCAIILCIASHGFDWTEEFYWQLCIFCVNVFWIKPSQVCQTFTLS